MPAHHDYDYDYDYYTSFKNYKAAKECVAPKPIRISLVGINLLEEFNRAPPLHFVKNRS